VKSPVKQKLNVYVCICVVCPSVTVMALISLSSAGVLTDCADMLVVVRNGRVPHCRMATPSVTVCCHCGVHRLLSRPTPAALPGELLPASATPFWVLTGPKMSCISSLDFSGPEKS